MWGCIGPGKTVFATVRLRGEQKDSTPPPTPGSLSDAASYFRLSLVLRFEVIQRPIHRQFTKHDHLRNTQQGVAIRRAQQPGEIAEHHTRRGQGFAGIDQQLSSVFLSGATMNMVLGLRGVAQPDKQ